MMQWLLAALWCLAFAGHVWFWTEKGRVHPALSPLAAMSVITLWLYAGGMIRLLLPAAVIALAAGLFFLGWMLQKRSHALLQRETALFALGCVLLWLRYRGALLVQYDDYSHWGMMVRHLLAHNRLPGPEDTLITFQSYPPGAALWMYGVCRFMGGSDGMMLAAQAAMTLAGWMGLFAFAQGEGAWLKRAALTMIALVGLSLFQGTASLMVDNLIAAQAVGALCLLVWMHREKTRHAWLAGVMIALVCLTKDSGLFFAGVLGVLYLALYLRKKKPWFKGFMGLCIPAAAARLIWLVHIKLAFPAADVSRHALTIENLRKTGADKSYGDMFTILKNLLNRVCSLQNQAVQVLLVMLAVCMVLIIVRKARTGRLRPGPEALIWLGCFAAYAAWVLSMGMMYIFNMPIQNALELVAYERYNSTCALFLFGVLALWMLTVPVKGSARLAAFCAAAVMIAPLLTGAWTAGLPRLFREDYFVPLRSRMEALYQARPLQAGERAAVLVNEADAGTFAEYMARYSFQSAEMAVVTEAPADADVVYAACDTKPEASGIQIIDWQDLV